MDGGVDSKQYLLTVTHWSRIQAAGVDDRRRRLIATEHNHQVADHRRFAFFVEVDDATLTEASERELDHAHCTVDDTRAGGHDCAGLLTAQHGLGDLRSVGEVADPYLDDLEPGDDDPLRDFPGELARDDVGRAAQ